MTSGHEEAGSAGGDGGVYCKKAYRIEDRHASEAPLAFRLMGWLLAATLLLGVQSSPVQAAESASTEVRVPLAQNFTPAQQVGTYAMVAGGLSLYFFQSPIYHGLGAPVHIKGAFDWEVNVSNALYAGPGKRFLGGAPDVFGERIAPYGALVFYAADAITQGVRGTGFTGDVNADHAFYAFAQAYAINLSATQLAKIFIGRERPFYYLKRDPTASRTDDSYFSFFSGHSSSSFCLAAFITRDVTDGLLRGALANASPQQQLLLGRILPGTALYGTAALIAFSRVVDQRHFVTDVVTGSLVGALVGNIVYAVHFDEKGLPRVRYPDQQRAQASMSMGWAVQESEYAAHMPGIEHGFSNASLPAEAVQRLSSEDGGSASAALPPVFSFGGRF